MEEKHICGPKWRENVFMDKFCHLKKVVKKCKSLPYLDFSSRYPKRRISFILPKAKQCTALQFGYPLADMQRLD